MAGLAILLLMISSLLWMIRCDEYREQLKKCREELENYKHKNGSETDEANSGVGGKQAER